MPLVATQASSDRADKKNETVVVEKHILLIVRDTTSAKAAYEVGRGSLVWLAHPMLEFLTWP